MAKLLVLFHSRHGATQALAEAIAQGIEASGCEAVLRRVPEVSNGLDTQREPIPDTGYLYVTKKDIMQCDGLAMGSPTHFGNMAAPLKYFIDSLTDVWVKGGLVDKPACVFTSSSSMHGGQESTLLSMMLPLIHHGMCILGLPYSEAKLHETKTGGTPYGVSCVSGDGFERLSDDEHILAVAMGRRLAAFAQK
ncbi:NAD(P)H:quinone oxidoreductase [Glaciecola sp. XM2]|jgi:NAD(P)H dehydrogenase (quinone)|uniref:NAD(P)H:quinone oxidoreductase n=1 Tax=Glaciecola sp. XM2 TaxID=1914931 RepID=UPI001BDF31CA|nr:NAD(P)H:quinone oxidoreductase [Glaciecola sp. XM2]MBT1449586.1 NAD(P)H:quinone oxidoreductase [Glaciecola sp. XM2]